MERTEQTGIFLGIAATIFFSFKSVIAKFAYTLGTDPLTLLHMRLYVAVPLLLVTLLVRERRALSSIASRDWGAMFLLGAFGISVAMAASFYSIELIDASLANVLTFIYPVITVLFLIPIAGVRPTAATWLALSVALAGIVLVGNPQLAPDPGDRFLAGVALALVSAIAFAAYNAFAELILRRVSGLQLAAVGITSCTLALVALTGPRFSTDPGVVACALLLGVVSGYLPFLAYPLAIQKIGATRVVIINTLGPPMTLLWAWLVLDESMRFSQLVGMGLILFAVAVASLGKMRQIQRRFSSLGKIRGSAPDPPTTSVMNRKETRYA